MGRRLFTSVGSPSLGKGVTLAIFQLVGNTFFLMDKLKRYVTWCSNTLNESLIIKVEMFLIAEDFAILIFSTCSKTSCGLTSISSNSESNSVPLQVHYKFIAGMRRRLIQVCEQYAVEYHVKFNGKKSKLMCFDKRRNNSYVDLAVVVNNESVKVVETMDYLGHTIVNDRHDSLINSVKREYVTKIKLPW